MNPSLAFHNAVGAGTQDLSGTVRLPAGGSLGRVEALVWPANADQPAHVATGSGKIDLQVTGTDPSDGGKHVQFAAGLSNVEDASWDLGIPLEGTNGGRFAADASLDRSTGGGLKFTYKDPSGGRNDNGLTIKTILNGAPDALNATFRDHKIVYDAPGTTSRAKFNVSGLRMPGLDGRPVTGVKGTLYGVQDAVTVRADSGNAFNISGGAISDGQMDVTLGPETRETSTEMPNLDLQIGVDIGSLTLKAASDQDVDVVQEGGYENQLVVSEDNSEFAAYAKLRNVQSLTYRARNVKPSTDPCVEATYKIERLDIQTAAGQDLAVAFDAVRDRRCESSDEGNRVRWLLEMRDVPSRLRLAEDGQGDLIPAELQLLEKVFVPLDTSAGSVGELQLHTPFLDDMQLHARLQDVPSTSRLDFGVRFPGGVAFSGRADPASGTIGQATFGLASQRDDLHLALALRHADIKGQFDLDGSTRHEGVPSFFFVDTDGKWTSGSIRIYNPDHGLGVRLGGLSTEGFQVHRPQLSLDPRKVIPVNGVWQTSVDVSSSLSAEFKLGGTWYRVPAPMEWWVQ